MSLDSCADLLARADPDRFRTVLAAPRESRPALLAIYAFNVEVTRAPWVTAEPMIAEMRLQWWRDALEEIADGRTVRAHEVATPLAQVLDADGAKILDRLVSARRWDIYSDPFEDEDHFRDYLDATSASLMWVAARSLGADPATETAVRHVGWAAGLAALFRAIPELETRGRKPLVDGREEAVSELATAALARLHIGRKMARGPALLAAWMAGPILRQAEAAPQRVASGTLGTSEFWRRARLNYAALTGHIPG